ncbi:hypothetical protein BB559_004249 [Furculomyces boomerangus]|uniref:tRNA-intron lyase n=1 Tax=Furculomyces boomerangus TaxID=61424 RepID=A0A2T9YFT3_9FUNG|nr:hypothetical protein BB559_006703 [Furculomyces boomerangus]PVU91202.1 hypothetical protein BB559_004249 [Furculomyces boomerangus]
MNGKKSTRKIETGFPLPVIKTNLPGTSIVNWTTRFLTVYGNLFDSKETVTSDPNRIFMKLRLGLRFMFCGLDIVWERLLKQIVLLPYRMFFGYRISINKNCTAIISEFPSIETGCGTNIQIWCYNQETIRFLWINGNFGKGILSRSQPTWEGRYKKHLENTDSELYVEEITLERRAKKYGSKSALSKNYSLVTSTEASYMEPIRLTLCETLFLSTALGCLVVVDEKNNKVELCDLWKKILFSTNKLITWDHDILVEYAAYYYYRSRGWVVRPGLKFALDFILYKDGPQSNHSQFGVKIIKVSEGIKSNRETDFELRLLHSLNRICSQVKKTLIICYVHVPDCGTVPNLPLIDVSNYKITEIRTSRFNPDQNR